MTIIVRRCLEWTVFFTMTMVFALAVNQVFASDGDQTTTGIIIKTGFGKISLNIAEKEAQFNTGRVTKYEPSDFRPRLGDTVKVTYFDKEHAGRTIQAVNKLELIKANPNFKEPPNPTTGTIKEAGRKAFHVYIPEIKKSWKFEMARGAKIIPSGWKPAVDETVKISYKRVPSRFTSGLVYQIKSLEKT